jgi:hypothetical protein
VPATLGALRGPSSGIVSLPEHLAWSGQRTFNLGDLADARHYVQIVLREAASTEDLAEYLDEAMVRRFSHDLFLPVRLRAAYGSVFPELRTPGDPLVQARDR